MFTFYYCLANYLKVSVHLSAYFGKEDVTLKNLKLSTGTPRNSMAISLNHSPATRSLTNRHSKTCFSTLLRQAKCCFGAVQHFCATKKSSKSHTILQSAQLTSSYSILVAILMLFLSSVKRLRKVKGEGNTNKLLNTTLAIFLVRSPRLIPKRVQVLVTDRAYL